MWRILRLPNARWCHLEAAVCLVVARLVYVVPFKWLTQLLGTAASGHAPAALHDAVDRSEAMRVSRATIAVAEFLPWESSCLVRGVAACMMLRRRGLPGILHCGVKLDAEKPLEAHAWVTCGDIAIVGTETAAQFAPLAAFSAPTSVRAGGPR